MGICEGSKTHSSHRLVHRVGGTAVRKEIAQGVDRGVGSPARRGQQEECLQRYTR